MVTGRGVIVYLLLVALLIPSGVVGMPDTVEQTDTDLEADDIVLQIHLNPDGSATWTIEHRYRLADEDAEAAFADLRADIETNESAYLNRFTDRMEPTVASAADSTGREMAVENVSITAETRSLPQEYGIIRYQFEWFGFAVFDDGQLIAGDAVSGLFLDDETRLIVSWTDEYTLDRAAPNPDEVRDQLVQWHGPTDFGPNEPRVVLVRSDSGVIDDPSDDPLLGVGSNLLLGLGVLALAILGGALFIRRRGTRAAGTGTIAAVEAERGDGDLDAETDEPEWGLMSNEEKVVRLLERNGGRMKQQEVTTTFGWSAANTSQVIRELREKGAIETFRIGRENVIVLPDEDSKETRL